MVSLMIARYRTLIVLGLAQCFGQTASPMMVLLGGIVGARLAPSIDWATLPLAIMVVGMACTTVPASLLMARIGRRGGFLIASACAVGTGLVAVWGIYLESFIIFCCSSFLVGANGAFIQQFRFAVAESVPTEQVPKSLSILMLAGIFAAIVGPETANRLSEVGGLPDYVGSFLGMSGLLFIAFLILFFFYENADLALEPKGREVRPYSEILIDRNLLLAMGAAIVGWSVMTLVMTATPVSMHEMDHHSLDDTTWVIQSHILAMYVPSLFSGFLISWFGVVRILYAGLAVMTGVVIFGYGQPDLFHYWGAMVLLGIGWNFLFIGGTTLLTQTYRSEERFKVQALNDFLVFGLQAMASLGAGLLLANFGWNGVMMLCLPWLIILLPLIFLARRSVQAT
jgi:MFS family permease